VSGPLLRKVSSAACDSQRSKMLTRPGSTRSAFTTHFNSKLINYPRQPGVVEGSRFAPNDEGERLRYDGYAVYLRTAEAMTIRAHLDRLLTDPGDARDGLGRSTAVVFCGDLTDEPDAATTQIIQGPMGSEIDLRPGSAFQRSGERGCSWRRSLRSRRAR
jgi:hypothetical protein